MFIMIIFCILHFSFSQLNNNFNLNCPFDISYHYMEISSKEITTNNCKCFNKGLFFNNNTTNCESCPENSFFNRTSFSCLCNNGYYFNSTLNKCECSKVILNDLLKTCTDCPVNSIKKSDKCECSNGYTWNSISNTCICLINQLEINGKCLFCPSNSSKDNKNNVCICNNGYSWNSTSNQCECSRSDQYIYNGITCITCPPDSTKNFNSCICKLKTIMTFSLSLSKCTCINPNSIVYNGNCANCPSLSKRDSFNSCKCNSNRYWSSIDNKCYDCINNTILSYNTTTSTCLCKNRSLVYINTTNSCVDCPLNSVKIQNDNKCLCNNQLHIWNNKNNLCMCSNENQVYIKSKNLCLDCPIGSTISDNFSSCICSNNNTQSLNISDIVWNSENNKCICKNSDLIMYDNQNCVACPDFAYKISEDQCQCNHEDLIWDRSKNSCECQGNKDSLIAMKWNNTLNMCVCNDNEHIYDSINKKCIKCPENSYKKTDLTCECYLEVVNKSIPNTTTTSIEYIISDNFSIENNKCVCSENKVFNNKSKKCEACPVNSIYNNHICECLSEDKTWNQVLNKCECDENKNYIPLYYNTSLLNNTINDKEECVLCKNGIQEIRLPAEQVRLKKCQCNEKSQFFDNISNKCKCKIQSNQALNNTNQSLQCIDCSLMSLTNSEISSQYEFYLDQNLNFEFACKCNDSSKYFNKTLNKCICKYGFAYDKKTNKCIDCSKDQFYSDYSDNNQTCLCSKNRKWIESNLTFSCACQSNQIINHNQACQDCEFGKLNTNTCNCSDNTQIFINDKCQCKVNSLKSNLCINCLDFKKYNGVIDYNKENNNCICSSSLKQFNKTLERCLCFNGSNRYASIFNTNSSNGKVIEDSCIDCFNITGSSGFSNLNDGYSSCLCLNRRTFLKKNSSYICDCLDYQIKDNQNICKNCTYGKVVNENKCICPVEKGLEWNSQISDCSCSDKNSYFDTNFERCVSCSAIPGSVKVDSARTQCICNENLKWDSINSNCICKNENEIFKIETLLTEGCFKCPSSHISKTSLRLSSIDCYCDSPLFYNRNLSSCDCLNESIRRNETLSFIQNQIFNDSIFLNNTNKCEKCPSNTKKISINRCSCDSIRNYYSLSANSSLTICKNCPIFSNFHTSVKLEECLCNDRYIWMKDEEKCLKCQDNQISINNQRCYSCSYNEYIKNNQCIACPLLSLPVNDRTSCNCNKRTEENLINYHNQTDNTCRNCNLREIYDHLTKKCIICNDTQIRVDNQCINCPDESITDKENNICLCSDHSIYNITINKCIECPVYQIVKNGVCEDCPDFQFARLVANANENTKLNLVCDYCSGSSITYKDYKLMGKFYLINTQEDSLCIKCPFRNIAFKVNNTCGECDSTQISNEIDNICISCNMLYPYKIVNTTSNTCEYCPENRFYFEDVNLVKQCLSCPSPRSYVNKTINKCIDCKKGEISNSQTNQCEACPINKIQVGNECVECSYCTEADKSINDCVKSSTKFCYKNQLYTECPKGTIIDLYNKNNCVPCSTYEDKSIYEQDGKCVSKCSLTYYPNEYLFSCFSCKNQNFTISSFLSNCSKESCLLNSSSNRFFFNYICSEKCPDMTGILLNSTHKIYSLNIPKDSVEYIVECYDCGRINMFFHELDKTCRKICPKGYNSDYKLMRCILNSCINKDCNNGICKLNENNVPKCICNKNFLPPDCLISIDDSDNYNILSNINSLINDISIGMKYYEKNDFTQNEDWRNESFFLLAIKYSRLYNIIDYIENSFSSINFYRETLLKLSDLISYTVNNVFNQDDNNSSLSNSLLSSIDIENKISFYDFSLKFNIKFGFIERNSLNNSNFSLEQPVLKTSNRTLQEMKTLTSDEKVNKNITNLLSSIMNSIALTLYKYSQEYMSELDTILSNKRIMNYSLFNEDINTDIVYIMNYFYFEIKFINKNPVKSYDFQSNFTYSSVKLNEECELNGVILNIGYNEYISSIFNMKFSDSSSSALYINPLLLYKSDQNIIDSIKKCNLIITFSFSKIIKTQLIDYSKYKAYIDQGINIYSNSNDGMMDSCYSLINTTKSFNTDIVDKATKMNMYDDHYFSCMEVKNNSQSLYKSTSIEEDTCKLIDITNKSEIIYECDIILNMNNSYTSIYDIQSLSTYSKYMLSTISSNRKINNTDYSNTFYILSCTNKVFHIENLLTNMAFLYFLIKIVVYFIFYIGIYIIMKHFLGLIKNPQDYKGYCSIYNKDLIRHSDILSYHESIFCYLSDMKKKINKENKDLKNTYNEFNTERTYKSSGRLESEQSHMKNRKNVVFSNKNQLNYIESNNCIGNINIKNQTNMDLIYMKRKDEYARTVKLNRRIKGNRFIGNIKHNNTDFNKYKEFYDVDEVETVKLDNVSYKHKTVYYHYKIKGNISFSYIDYDNMIFSDRIMLEKHRNFLFFWKEFLIRKDFILILLDISYINPHYIKILNIIMIITINILIGTILFDEHDLNLLNTNYKESDLLFGFLIREHSKRLFLSFLSSYLYIKLMNLVYFLLLNKKILKSVYENYFSLKKERILYINSLFLSKHRIRHLIYIILNLFIYAFSLFYVTSFIGVFTSSFVIIIYSVIVNYLFYLIFYLIVFPVILYILMYFDKKSILLGYVYCFLVKWV